MPPFKFFLQSGFRSFFRIWTGVFLLVITGCAALPDNTNRQESYAFTETGRTFLGKALADEIGTHPGQSGFVLLAGGLDAFTARLVLGHWALTIPTYIMLWF